MRMMYLHFVVCLCFGVAGLGFVLTILIDSILHDWDVAEDIHRLRTGLSRRKRYVHRGLSQPEPLVSRLSWQRTAPAKTADAAPAYPHGVPA
jgi:hypothetical protein